MLPSGLHGFSSKQPFLQSPELTRLIWIRNNEILRIRGAVWF
jgi:hypothetical protein